MIMLSGGKSLEEKGVGGGEASCDYSAVSSVDNFHILECHRRKTSQERYMWEVSGWMKICIGTEKERFSERAWEGRSNRTEYPMTKVQFGAEVLGWEQKEKV